MEMQPTYIVCDYCGGVIPEGAGRIRLGAVEIATDQGEGEVGMKDFCCTDHVNQYLAKNTTVIPTPHPTYPAPPAASVG